MRKSAIALSFLLACSAAANIFLFHRVATLHSAIRENRKSLAIAGAKTGWVQAESDFAAGRPLWYYTGDFGVPVPKDKPGRKGATVGCLISDYDRAFVESYNKRMDELFAAKGRDDAT